MIKGLKDIQASVMSKKIFEVSKRLEIEAKWLWFLHDVLGETLIVLNRGIIVGQVKRLRLVTNQVIKVIKLD